MEVLKPTAVCSQPLLRPTCELLQHAPFLSAPAAWRVLGGGPERSSGHGGSCADGHGTFRWARLEGTSPVAVARSAVRELTERQVSASWLRGRGMGPAGPGPVSRLRVWGRWAGTEQSMRPAVSHLPRRPPPLTSHVISSETAFAHPFLVWRPSFHVPGVLTQGPPPLLIRWGWTGRGSHDGPSPPPPSSFFTLLKVFFFSVCKY